MVELDYSLAFTDDRYVNITGDTMTGDLKILKSSALLTLETADATDPTLTFKTTNTANQINVHLNESVSVDQLCIVGQTASVDTIVTIDAKDGENAQLRLYSGGTNYGLLQMSSSDHVSLKNMTQDMDLIFRINDGGVAKTITWNADVDLLQHSAGLFNFDNDNLTTTGDVTTADLKLSGGDIYPTADSTTAIQINKADGTTNVLNVDTTNARVGIGTATPTVALDLVGKMLITPAADAVDVFKVTQADTTAVFDVDTTNRKIVVTSGTTGQSTIGAGLIVNNDSGLGTINDFQVNSDTLTAILVDASADTLTIGVNTTIADGKNIVLDTTTGTKIGTAVGQKLGFWNVTPVIQPVGATQAAPAAYATGAFGLDSDANMQALYDLVVAIRTALVNAGIIKGAA